MSEKISVTFTGLKVWHDGTSMIVKKEGESASVTPERAALFLAEGAIEPYDIGEEGEDIAAPLQSFDGQAVDLPEGDASEAEAIDLNEDERAHLPQLDHDQNGEAGGSESGGEGEDIAALRAEYKELLGKAVFPGWDVEEIRRRMAEFRAQQHEGEASDADEDEGDTSDDDDAGGPPA